MNGTSPQLTHTKLPFVVPLKSLSVGSADFSYNNFMRKLSLVTVYLAGNLHRKLDSTVRSSHSNRSDCPLIPKASKYRLAVGANKSNSPATFRAHGSPTLSQAEKRAKGKAAAVRSQNFHTFYETVRLPANCARSSRASPKKPLLSSECIFSGCRSERAAGKRRNAQCHTLITRWDHSADSRLAKPKPRVGRDEEVREIIDGIKRLGRSPRLGLCAKVVCGRKVVRANTAKERIIGRRLLSTSDARTPQSRAKVIAVESRVSTKRGSMGRIVRTLAHTSRDFGDMSDQERSKYAGCEDRG